MATTPWFRLPREVQRREQDRTLREWVRREVTPFSRFWRDRIAGIDVTGTRIWEDREQVFGRLRDPGLNAWYQLKTAGP